MSKINIYFKSKINSNFVNKKAFSLIELSIVILIIGILVAGVTSSSRLLKQMKLTSARSMTLSSPVSSITQLVAWFETTLDSSFDSSLSNNDKVALWKDINPQSSYKYQFVSTDPTYQPVYSDSGVNGLPSLVFNTSHMFLYNFQIGANYTFFYVFNASSIHPNGSTMIQILDTSYSNGSIAYEIQPSAGAYLGFNRRMRALHRTLGGGAENDNYANSNGIVNDGKDYVFAYNRNFRTNKTNFYTNGVDMTETNTAYTSATVPALNSNNFTIFMGNLSPTNFGRPFLGKLSELIIFDKSLSTEELTSVNNYLLKKYNIK
jgi:prepilin-type N-terminal cleavage/methylation domain-containing protein